MLLSVGGVRTLDFLSVERVLDDSVGKEIEVVDFQVPSVPFSDHLPVVADFVLGIVASVASEASVPQDYALLGNFPNPFNPVTEIRFGLTRASDVHLDIYNLRGARVIRLVSEAIEEFGSLWASVRKTQRTKRLHSSHASIMEI